MGNTEKRLQRSMVTVVIVVLATLLPACSSQQASTTVPAGAQAGDLVGLQSCTYEAKEVEYAADCRTLVVPENRSDPNSQLIVLPVIRVRATGDDPAETVFFLSDGPGTSNLYFGHLEDVIEQHDVVLVGYRGVDGSVVLDCPEISDAIRSARGVLSDQALESYTAAGASCAERLQADADKCIDCKRCTSECPMSLDVHQMVRAGDMEHDECILCASCIDACPKGVIAMPFHKG